MASRHRACRVSAVSSAPAAPAQWPAPMPATSRPIPHVVRRHDKGPVDGMVCIQNDDGSLRVLLLAEGVADPTDRLIAISSFRGSAQRVERTPHPFLSRWSTLVPPGWSGGVATNNSGRWSRIARESSATFRTLGALFDSLVERVAARRTRHSLSPPLDASQPLQHAMGRRLERLVGHRWPIQTDSWRSTDSPFDSSP